MEQKKPASNLKPGNIKMNLLYFLEDQIAVDRVLLDIKIDFPGAIINQYADKENPNLMHAAVFCNNAIDDLYNTEPRYKVDDLKDEQRQLRKRGR